MGGGLGRSPIARPPAPPPAPPSSTLPHMPSVCPHHHPRHTPKSTHILHAQCAPSSARAPTTSWARSSAHCPTWMASTFTHPTQPPRSSATCCSRCVCVCVWLVGWLIGWLVKWLIGWSQEQSTAVLATPSAPALSPLARAAPPQGTLQDHDVLQERLRRLLGDMTFAEAYQRSGGSMACSGSGVGGWWVVGGERRLV